MPSFSRSRLAARLQNIVSGRREEVSLYREIAHLLDLAECERVLDVGTGSGLQLRVIHDLRPLVELHGLDLSTEALRFAADNLSGLDVHLRVGGIEQTSYDDGYFDLVTCNSSMSYWENLGVCFNEIYRILRPGGAAVLFEPRKNIDIDEAVEIIKRNLAGESALRRFAAVNLNRFGLRWGRTLGLRLYSIEELEEIARESFFGDRVAVDPATLQNLPIFMRIHLTKPAGRSDQRVEAIN